MLSSEVILILGAIAAVWCFFSIAVAAFFKRKLLFLVWVYFIALVNLGILVASFKFPWDYVEKIGWHKFGYGDTALGVISGLIYLAVSGPLNYFVFRIIKKDPKLNVLRLSLSIAWIPFGAAVLALVIFMMTFKLGIH